MTIGLVGPARTWPLDLAAIAVREAKFDFCSGSGLYKNEFGSAEWAGRVRCVAWGIRHENGGGFVVVGFYRERDR